LRGDNGPPPSNREFPPHYKTSLLSIGVLGVAICWWVYYFTDWFEIFSSLLALGGIFSWLAFVAKILPEERVKQFQDWVDNQIVLWRRAWRWAIILAAVLVGVAECWGTVEVRALRATGPVRIQSASAAKQKDPAWELLPAGGKLRFLVWSPPWARANILVKVSGLPDHAETIRGLARVDLQVPDSFRRPVLLLRPTADVTQQLANQPRVLVVRFGNNEPKRKMFHGQSLWVNCDADVEIPPEMIARWRTELDKLSSAQLIEEWVNPESLDHPTWKFNAGEHVEIELRDDGNNLVACAASYTVRALPERADASQEGVLDVKDSADPKCTAKFALTVTPQ